MLGSDGYPRPMNTQKQSYKVTCCVCISGDAAMDVTKKQNWVIRCRACNCIIYLNSPSSINLFRGFQTLLNADPAYQITHTRKIVENAPDAGQ